MSWDTSTRRSRLPGDWPRRRATVFKRDGYRCTMVTNGQRCTHTDPTGATIECDHIIRGDDHRIANLTTLCGRGSPANHHAVKTAAEAAAARRATTNRRPPEPHPGMV